MHVFIYFIGCWSLLMLILIYSCLTSIRDQLSIQTRIQNETAMAYLEDIHAE